MSDPGSNGDEPESGQRYEGYSDYQSVSQQIAASVDEAIEGYAKASSYSEEGTRWNQTEAVEAKAAIRGAALKLMPEMRMNKEASGSNGHDFEEMLERWTENGVDDDTGYIEAIKNVNFWDPNYPVPEWVEDFVIDIRTAAFELGYLKAGRTVEESGLDPVEEDVNAMFEGIQL